LIERPIDSMLSSMRSRKQLTEVFYKDTVHKNAV